LKKKAVSGETAFFVLYSIINGFSANLFLFIFYNNDAEKPPQVSF